MGWEPDDASLTTVYKDNVFVFSVTRPQLKETPLRSVWQLFILLYVYNTHSVQMGIHVWEGTQRAFDSEQKNKK